jgi:1,4-dihydroxy-2-naphthoyl-CoA hydrolase
MTEPHLQRALLPLERTLAGTLGFRLLHLGDDHASASFAVDDRVRQPYGIVHGGAYAAAAETLCSHATAHAVDSDGMLAMGQANDTSFLRPVFEGNVHAHAQRKHRGRTTWVWEVEFTDDAGRLCALSRVTLAVRSAEGA